MLYMLQLKNVCKLVLLCIFLKLGSCISFTDELICVALDYNSKSLCFSMSHPSKLRHFSNFASLSSRLGKVYCTLLRPSGDPPCQLELCLMLDYPFPIPLAHNTILASRPSSSLLVLPHCASQASISQCGALQTSNGY